MSDRIGVVKVPAAANIGPQSRRYYRLGYRDGLKGYAAMIPTRLYEIAYSMGYDDGLRAAGHKEVKPFEVKR